MSFDHSDTYGIAINSGLQYDTYQTDKPGSGYHRRMTKSLRGPPPEWGGRFRDHRKKMGWKWSKVAEMTGWAEPTLRSWTNGTRKINFDDLLLLCKKTQADPAVIVFGTSTINPEQRELLRTVARAFAEGTH